MVINIQRFQNTYKLEDRILLENSIAYEQKRI